MKLLTTTCRPHWFSTAALAAAPPLVKLAALAIGVAVIGALVQCGAWLLGLDFWILNSSGSGVLIVTAMMLLLAMIASEGRPMADYGLIAERSWRRHAGLGLLLGGGVYAGYISLAWLTGAAHFSTESLSGSRIGKAGLAAMSAGPLAVTQQIIFAGYLVSMLRERHSRAISVMVPALIFAIACSAGRWKPETGPLLLLSMFMLSSLLNLWRLRTGSIALSAGVLAGCIVVRKVLSKTRLVSIDLEAPGAWLLAPYGDPRLGLVMMSIVGFGIAWVGYELARYGEHKPQASDEANATFMKILPFSNLLCFTPIDRWVVLLWQARFRVGLKYIPRLVVTLIASVIGTIVALPERLLCPLLMRRDPPDPVFIVGMLRSGTTHLHNLLSLDPQFRSPRNYEVFNPHGFLSGWITTALLTPALSWRRPMDSMQMSVTSSQEEEFALAAMGSPSPYWTFGLPHEIDRHDAYWRPEGFSDQEESLWARQYKLFLRKITCWRRRVPLLKNPANTGRVKMLRKHFPRGKFIHIIRRPQDVWRSNQRLASHGLVVFQLQDSYPNDSYATRCLANYRSMMDAYYEDTANLPPGTAVEIRYEDLVNDPLGEIRRAYAELGMELTPPFEQQLTDYLQSISNYRRNRFATLSPEEEAKVVEAMGHYLQQWGYVEEQRRAAA